MIKTIYIVACQARPALVKIGLLMARLFHFNSLLVRIRLVKVLRMPMFTVTVWANTHKLYVKALTKCIWTNKL